MSKTLEAIHLLEDRLQKLLVNYEFLKEENEVLLNSNAKLQYLLQEKQSELEAKEEEYKLLKIAKTIEGSNENTRETKLKINALIREIDKCITLLNS
ncbi:hypothetical protein WH52_09830 [Tenacibaculum holothuriorum]|uniref:Phenylalanyl-tRNA synthetase subunit beta n=1 Tax=Tenacibaculum holothuriorum TaxID=1635173 RepID=A0A1Y2PC17_9FLAO|nr:hypothetical protein [Tenacibaculum holothuriorum]OSY87720.1 hypothetical protein WH52_09830 [Tenacibaculum holothuriorum]